MPFTAFRIHDDEPRNRIETIETGDLRAGDTLVKVTYSGLNYKDALAVTNTGKIIRDFPMVPGIDYAGTVIESEHFAPGTEVLLTGWGVGERHDGGLAGVASAKAKWLLPLPAGLSARHAMALGTAGLTAMLAVMAIEDGGVTPASGPIAVTGAGGGVGGIAIKVLAGLGYDVHAVSGRPEQAERLKALGASTVVDRSELARDAKPLEAGIWAGAVDAVGGQMLSTILATCQPGAVVTAMGNAGGIGLKTTVFPFILRGVRLQGIDSVFAPLDKRAAAWARLATAVPEASLEGSIEEIGLEGVEDACQRLVAGQVAGRILVRLAP
ncbi:acryloyl-CoA reductase [Litorivicinus lipolyticus]|uniref:Acryloyl-CoA reductase n=1 Tax=Litorivicinus lipolyticus TaxID=418701 RepID=A0A5Q2QG50_9GAMM|nr:acryloyl-CoA reductase [Litorivicinus lipolyticus]QGG80810.1 acryloyl-CoA reductase [Litorivicinus lipolyticus]